MRVCRRMHVCTKIYAAYATISQQKKCVSVYCNPDRTPKNKGLNLLHIVDTKACNINQRMKFII